MNGSKKIMDKKTEKYNTILKEYLDIVSPEDKSLYEELANKAIILGYVPTRDKIKGISISFRNNKTKFTIMKFAEEGKNGYFWRFKFAACKSYSKIFDESIKKYDDGRKYTVCGTVAFVQINKISKEIVEEAGNMMKIQHEKLIEG